MPICKAACLLLDTFDWAGSNTTLDVIACYLPIVNERGLTVSIPYSLL
ncbi:hypothetical protein [Nostoc sp.]